MNCVSFLLELNLNGLLREQCPVWMMWGFPGEKCHHSDVFCRCGKPNRAEQPLSATAAGVCEYVHPCKCLYAQQRVPNRPVWGGARLKEECTCISRNLSLLCVRAVWRYTMWRCDTNIKTLEWLEERRTYVPLVGYHYMILLDWNWTVGDNKAFFHIHSMCWI